MKTLLQQNVAYLLNNPKQMYYPKVFKPIVYNQFLIPTSLWQIKKLIQSYFNHFLHKPPVSISLINRWWLGSVSVHSTYLQTIKIVKYGVGQPCMVFVRLEKCERLYNVLTKYPLRYVMISTSFKEKLIFCCWKSMMEFLISSVFKKNTRTWLASSNSISTLHW